MADHVKPDLNIVPDVDMAATSPIADDASDDALMRATADGSRTAFDTLTQRHYGRAHAVASRILRSTSVAHDATQNAFIELFLGAGRYQARGRFRSFLYRVVLNHCRMLQRRSFLHQRVVARLDAPPSISPPSEDTDQAERRKIVDAAMQKLGPKLREVVELRFTGDLSCTEIAEILQIPVGTVQSRLFNALKKLRVDLEDA